MKNLLGLIWCFGLLYSAKAQLTISNGNHSMEISGAISTYYNYRVLKPGEDRRNKDRYRLRDAQIQIEGRISNTYEYELQVDFADLATAGADPENPGIMDGYITYKGLKFMNITFGYGKVPYSRASLVPFVYSPYWQRAEFLRGDFFARRDIGITLSKSMWKQRINVFAGSYTGIGEVGLLGDNDRSGALEYIGRVEFAYPSRYRYQDIDTRHVPLPMFVIGANGRYANRQLPQGAVFPTNTQGEYLIKVINGEKLAYGLDASFMYQGFSAQFEIHQMKMTPQSPTDGQLQGYPLNFTGGYFMAGGYVIQANYFSKKLKSIFSGRFEEYDLNDLVVGNTQRLSFAYAYQIKGYNSMVKAQVFNILRDDPQSPERWTEQFRIGWQVLFR
jgi:hypothetical protein